MNPESLQQLIATAAPLLSEWLAKPPARRNELRITGERLIAFLRMCPADVQLLANAIDPGATYLFAPECLRDLANPYEGHLQHAQAESL